MSIKLPNGKISLTLPEQVGKNAKDIEDIKKAIDGLDSLDNVVVVPDISHIMTAAELQSIKQPVCFIVYNDHLYIKKNEQSGSAYFEVVFSIVATTVISFQSSEIEVNLTNGALGITNSTVETYSKTTIDSLLSSKASITYVDTELAKKANLAGANFTGGITAPSIIEDMIGYSFNKGTTSGGNLTIDYAGVVKNGNKITFAIAGSYQKTSDTSNEIFGYFTIPSSVDDKLITFNITGLGAVLDYSTKQFVNMSNAVKADCTMTLYKNAYRQLFLRLQTNSGLTANNTYHFRYEITFLLSENLAS